MVQELVEHRLEGGVSTVTMDDGRVNALSPLMLREVSAALDTATEASALVLAGRTGVFSAGFDLSTLRSGGADAQNMVRGGLELAARLLSFPAPVLVACTGHAVAMGAFLLLAGDYRVGVSGDFRITANEVQLGLTMPRTAIEICRQRLTPAAFTRAVLLAEVFNPEQAVPAGFLDSVVEPGALDGSVRRLAAAYSALDPAAHRASKSRLRAPVLEAVRSALETDATELARAFSG